MCVFIVKIIILLLKLFLKLSESNILLWKSGSMKKGERVFGFVLSFVILKYEQNIYLLQIM